MISNIFLQIRGRPLLPLDPPLVINITLRNKRPPLGIWAPNLYIMGWLEFIVIEKWCTGITGCFEMSVMSDWGLMWRRRPLETESHVILQNISYTLLHDDILCYLINKLPYYCINAYNLHNSPQKQQTFTLRVGVSGWRQNAQKC
jgi:hypothetical protein